MNVMIAYDGSNHAKAAIDGLRRAGLPYGGNALVVTVGETVLPTPSPFLTAVGAETLSHRVASTLVQARAEAAHAIGEAGVLAREGVQRMHALFPRWGVYAHPVVGTAADAILQKADDWRADLIVVGSHGRSALGRLVLGSVSTRVALESRSSVRVARHVVERGDAPVRVIVCVDGSPGAEAAFNAVASRMWPAGTEARLIAVDNTVRPSGSISLLPQAAAWVNESNEEQRVKALEMLEQAADALLEAGLAVSTHTPEGSPQELLTEQATAWEADSIFVGARGLSGARERVRPGRVSTALITHAPCSVELIRV
jgi:nucleotide-binding universal stress UspA family protein